jgi:hypothetical protein
MSKECTTHHHACDCREEKFKQLEQENAALREDKERLDWLAVTDVWFDEPATESYTPETFRAEIDRKRKEAQP